MIFYISPGTDYGLYDRLQKSGELFGGYQSQKFNSNIIKGLAAKTEITVMSALPYTNVDAEELEVNADGVRYVTVANKSGKLHKLFNLVNLISAGKRLIKEKRPDFIVCDAISISHCVAALYLSKKYKIRSCAIITDVPEVMCGGGMDLFMKIDAWAMKRFDSYVLLTEQMGEIVNPKGKPYTVMEGSCTTDIPEHEYSTAKPRICVYGGALWEKEAGLEYFTEGFIAANIPDTELHFYGSGPFVDRIPKYGSDKVKYKGFVTNAEMTEILCRSALLVNPRPSGEDFCKYSFPSKTFEYMASGTPVLMTRLPGIPEEYFRYAFTIEEETPDGAKAALLKVFGTPHEELEMFGRSARAFITEKKNNFVQAEKVLEFLENSEHT